MNLIAINYTVVALGFLAFGILSAFGWRGKAPGVRLIVASLASALWGATIAISARGGGVIFAFVFVTEVLRNVAWLWFLSGIAGDFLPRGLKLITRTVSVLALAAALLWWLLPVMGLPIASPARLLSVGGLALSFLGLVALEQLYRNAHVTAQGALRYLAIGLGAIFIYDLFMYAQVELLRGLHTNEWMVRALVNVLALPFIVIAARRSTEWSVVIFVSRHVVFYTTAFTAVGIYLLLMAAGAYYVRAVGGTWGAAAQPIFFVGAGVVLLSMIFSVSLRRRVKVFIAKHFFSNKYDYRIEWLKFIDILSAANEKDVRQVALHAITEVMASPAGLLFTVADDAHAFVPNAYWPEAMAPRATPSNVATSQDLVRFLTERQWIIDLDEYRLTPDAYQNIQLPAWLVEDRTWRIISPLLQLDRLVGFVVLAAPPPPFELTYEDRDLLRTLGRHIATHIAQHDANSKLAEARQFEAFNRLTAFMMHDLKNAVAQMSLVVRNAERHKHNPEFVEDAISTIANAAGRIERLIEQLRQGSTAELNQRVLLERVVDRAVTSLATEPPAPVPVVSFVDEDMWVDADFERLSAVFGHLVRNAQEATPVYGEITVALERHGDEAWVIINDTGTGMDEAFIRERLFRPFDSTKGTRGMGIGVYQAREYLRTLRGEMAVHSNAGVGTRMTVRLPLANIQGITSSSAGSAEHPVAAS